MVIIKFNYLDTAYIIINQDRDLCLLEGDEKHKWNHMKDEPELPLWYWQF